MADKSFGIRQLNLIGASGTPKIESPNNLNLNAVTVAISTDVTIGGQVTSNIIVGTGKSVGIGTTNPVHSLQVGFGISTFVVTSNGNVGIGTTNPTSALTVVGNVNITGGITTVGGAATISGNVFIAGITTISGNLVNTGTFTQSGTFSPTDINTPGTITCNGLTVNGTTTTIDTVNLVVEDKNIGIGTTTSASNSTADGAGLTIFGGSDGDKTFVWNNNSDAFTFSNGVDIKGAVETVSTASTYAISGSTNVVLECDAHNGTVFTHSLANGQVGIVSLRDFPATKNSLTTYTIIFTQNATGTGNTTGSTGIGTNIRLTPYNIAGFSTSARVATASTVTLSSTANDIDIVSFAVHYNGGATGTVGNYNVLATNNGSFRYGGIRP